MMIVYLVWFTLSISYSMVPFHLVYVFQFLNLFFFLNILSQAFIKHSRKDFVCVCVCVCVYIYI